MRVYTLDGAESTWKMSESKKGIVSSYHQQARDLLKSIFPTLQILEEVGIPLMKSEVLYLDFYIPLLKTAIEVHGQQHYHYNSHYYNNQASFVTAKKRDKQKQEWLLLNNIKYIELPYNESINEWNNRLCNNKG